MKFYLNYFNINLLNRKVDFLKITIVENKIKIINKILYFNIFENLEYHLNLIKYFRNLKYFYI